MTRHGVRAPDNRTLSLKERQLLTWLLDHGKPSAQSYLAAIESLRVVARCGCGCASVDFLHAPSTPLEILSDHMWRDAAGWVFGIFAFAKSGQLAGLEVWSIDGEGTPTDLPDAADLVPLDTHAA